jgi:hypothetical protein
MLVLIVLGMSFLSLGHKEQIEVEAYSDNQGEQLLDDSVGLVTEKPDPNVDKAVFSPLDLPMVTNPLAAPTLAELSPNANVAGSNASAAPVGLALSGREKGMKKVLLRAFGGNEDTQAAVRRALEWFKRNQRGDGSWSLKGPYSDGAYDEDFPAATGMALLAFQGDGHTHMAGEHKAVVKKGWDALLKMQSPEGQFLGSGLSTQHQLYAHAQCTIAICELYGMTRDSTYRRPAERAIEFCVNSQDPKLGGWRYMPREDSDLSVTGWFLMALQSARMAGLEVPIETFEKSSKFLDSVQAAGGSQYTYTINGHSTPAMTAEGLLSRQYLGWKRDDQRLVTGAHFLVANPIKMGPSERDAYYWYYATQTLHHMEGDSWRQWNKVMRVEVPKAQNKDGRESGSWDPGPYKYGGEGGRLFITALQTYMLEVYYRHLPIYSDLGGRLGR